MITITFRQMEPNEKIKTYAFEKLSTLQSLLRNPMTMHVTLSVDGLDHVADVTLASGNAHFHSAGQSEDMRASIDVVHDKLARQIERSPGA